MAGAVAAGVAAGTLKRLELLYMRDPGPAPLLEDMGAALQRMDTGGQGASF